MCTSSDEVLYHRSLVAVVRRVGERREAVVALTRMVSCVESPLFVGEHARSCGGAKNARIGVRQSIAAALQVFTECRGCGRHGFGEVSSLDGVSGDVRNCRRLYDSP